VADDDHDFWQNWHKVWWGHLLFAALFLGLALFYYWHISAIEARGGGRAWWVVAIIYNWAGKWGSVLLFAIPGTILLFTGLWTFLKRDDED
jgi:hypothetical protein